MNLFNRKYLRPTLICLTGAIVALFLAALAPAGHAHAESAAAPIEEIVVRADFGYPEIISRCFLLNPKVLYLNTLCSS